MTRDELSNWVHENCRDSHGMIRDGTYIRRRVLQEFPEMPTDEIYWASFQLVYSPKHDIRLKLAKIMHSID